MQKLGERTPKNSIPFQRNIAQKTPVEEKRTSPKELFLQKDFSSIKDTTWHRILYPKHGMLLQVDGSEKAHKIRLQAHPPSQKLWLAINGTVIGSANKEILWNIQTGKHTLTLNDQHDNVIDKVHFEVR